MQLLQACVPEGVGLRANRMLASVITADHQGIHH